MCLFVCFYENTFSSSPQPLPSSRNQFPQFYWGFSFITFLTGVIFSLILRQTWYPLIFRLFWIIHTIDFAELHFVLCAGNLKKHKKFCPCNIYNLVNGPKLFLFHFYEVFNWLVSASMQILLDTYCRQNTLGDASCAQRTVQWWINTVFLPHSVHFSY